MIAIFMALYFPFDRMYDAFFLPVVRGAAG